MPSTFCKEEKKKKKNSTSKKKTTTRKAAAKKTTKKTTAPRCKPKVSPTKKVRKQTRRVSRRSCYVGDFDIPLQFAQTSNTFDDLAQNIQRAQQTSGGDVPLPGHPIDGDDQTATNNGIGWENDDVVSSNGLPVVSRPHAPAPVRKENNFAPAPARVPASAPARVPAPSDNVPAPSDNVPAAAPSQTLMAGAPGRDENISAPAPAQAPSTQAPAPTSTAAAQPPAPSDDVPAAAPSVPAPSDNVPAAAPGQTLMAGAPGRDENISAPAPAQATSTQAPAPTSTAAAQAPAQAQPQPPIATAPLDSTAQSPAEAAIASDPVLQIPYHGVNVLQAQTAADNAFDMVQVLASSPYLKRGLLGLSENTLVKEANTHHKNLKTIAEQLYQTGSKLLDAENATNKNASLIKSLRDSMEQLHKAKSKQVKDGKVISVKHDMDVYNLRNLNVLYRKLRAAHKKNDAQEGKRLIKAWAKQASEDIASNEKLSAERRNTSTITPSLVTTTEMPFDTNLFKIFKGIIHGCGERYSTMYAGSIKLWMMNDCHMETIDAKNTSRRCGLTGVREHIPGATMLDLPENDMLLWTANSKTRDFDNTSRDKTTAEVMVTSIRDLRLALQNKMQSNPNPTMFIFGDVGNRIIWMSIQPIILTWHHLSRLDVVLNKLADIPDNGIGFPDGITIPIFQHVLGEYLLVSLHNVADAPNPNPTSWKRNKMSTWSNNKDIEAGLKYMEALANEYTRLQAIYDNIDELEAELETYRDKYLAGSTSSDNNLAPANPWTVMVIDAEFTAKWVNAVLRVLQNSPYLKSSLFGRPHTFVAEVKAKQGSTSQTAKNMMEAHDHLLNMVRNVQSPERLRVIESDMREMKQLQLDDKKAVRDIKIKHDQMVHNESLVLKLHSELVYEEDDVAAAALISNWVEKANKDIANDNVISADRKSKSATIPNLGTTTTIALQPDLYGVLKGIIDGCSTQADTIFTGKIKLWKIEMCNMQPLNVELPSGTCGVSSVNAYDDGSTLDLPESDMLFWTANSHHREPANSDEISLVRSIVMFIRDMVDALQAQTSVTTNATMFMLDKTATIWLSIQPIKLDEKQLHRLDQVLRIVETIEPAYTFDVTKALLGEYVSMSAHSLDNASEWERKRGVSIWTNNDAIDNGLRNMETACAMFLLMQTNGEHPQEILNKLLSMQAEIDNGPPDALHGPPDAQDGPPDAQDGPPDAQDGPPDAQDGPPDAPPDDASDDASVYRPIRKRRLFGTLFLTGLALAYFARPTQLQQPPTGGQQHNNNTREQQQYNDKALVKLGAAASDNVVDEILSGLGDNLERINDGHGMAVGNATAQFLSKHAQSIPTVYSTVLEPAVRSPPTQTPQAVDDVPAELPPAVSLVDDVPQVLDQPAERPQSQMREPAWGQTSQPVSPINGAPEPNLPPVNEAALPTPITSNTSFSQSNGASPPPPPLTGLNPTAIDTQTGIDADGFLSTDFASANSPAVAEQPQSRVQDSAWGATSLPVSQSNGASVEQVDGSAPLILEPSLTPVNEAPLPAPLDSRAVVEQPQSRVAWGPISQPVSHVDGASPPLPPQTGLPTVAEELQSRVQDSAWGATSLPVSQSNGASVEQVDGSAPLILEPSLTPVNEAPLPAPLDSRAVVEQPQSRVAWGPTSLPVSHTDGKPMQKETHNTATATARPVDKNYTANAIDADGFPISDFASVNVPQSNDSASADTLAVAQQPQSRVEDSAWGPISQPVSQIDGPPMQQEEHSDATATAPPIDNNYTANAIDADGFPISDLPSVDVPLTALPTAAQPQSRMGEPAWGPNQLSVSQIDKSIVNTPVYVQQKVAPPTKSLVVADGTSLPRPRHVRRTALVMPNGPPVIPGVTRPVGYAYAQETNGVPVLQMDGGTPDNVRTNTVAMPSTEEQPQSRVESSVWGPDQLPVSQMDGL